MSRTLRFDDYNVAWLAFLPIEAEAAILALDQRHDGQFECVRTDDYIYIGGEINGHNTVIATLPEGQTYGTSSAAALASHIKARFPNIWFALVVGVAAGLPNLSPKPPAPVRDIRLGDVLVCIPNKTDVGIVQYDLGSHTHDGFLLSGRQSESPALVRAAIGHIKLTDPHPFATGTRLASQLASMQHKDAKGRFSYPHRLRDDLYEKSLHGPTLVKRHARDESEKTQVWYGSIGSGNSLMRNSKRKDQLRDKFNLIGLEMESAGVMNILQTGVIRGVSDYGDENKTKDWQPYAAAVAAIYAKGLLYAIRSKRGMSLPERYPDELDLQLILMSSTWDPDSADLSRAPSMDLSERTSRPTSLRSVSQQLQENLPPRSVPEALPLTINNGISMYKRKKYHAAEAMFRLYLGEKDDDPGALNHPHTLSSLHWLGLAVYFQDQYEEAKVNFQQALNGRETIFGLLHTETLSSMHWLGRSLYSQHQYEDSKRTLEQAFTGREEVLGSSHADTFSSRYWIGRSLYSQQQYEEAETIFRLVLSGQEQELGSMHRDTLETVQWLGHALSVQGEAMLLRARKGPSEYEDEDTRSLCFG